MVNTLGLEPGVMSSILIASIRYSSVVERLTFNQKTGVRSPVSEEIICTSINNIICKIILYDFYRNYSKYRWPYCLPYYSLICQNT